MDILSLSLGPNSPPGASSSTFLNILDLALLNAVKANVLVVQAAGNGGPYEKSMTSFSPWVVSVAAGVDDRSYPNTITLSDQTVLPGIALARKEKICCTFVLYVFFPSTPGIHHCDILLFCENEIVILCSDYVYFCFLSSCKVQMRKC